MKLLVGLVATWMTVVPNDVQEPPVGPDCVSKASSVEEIQDCPVDNQEGPSTGGGGDNSPIVEDKLD